jgi:hypothetical protein
MITKCPHQAARWLLPKSGSQIGVPNRGPKSESQIGVPNRGPKSGYQIGVSNRGPKWGVSLIEVINQGLK